MLRGIKLLIIFSMLSSCSLHNHFNGSKVALQCTSKTPTNKRVNLARNEKKGDTFCIDKLTIMDVVSLKKTVYKEDVPDELLELSKSLLNMEGSADFNVEANYRGQVLQRKKLKKLTAKTDGNKGNIFNLVCDGKFMSSMYMVDEVESGEFQLVVDDTQSKLIDKYCK